MYCYIVYYIVLVYIILYVFKDWNKEENLYARLKLIIQVIK